MAFTIPPEYGGKNPARTFEDENSIGQPLYPEGGGPVQAGDADVTLDIKGVSRTVRLPIGSFYQLPWPNQTGTGFENPEGPEGPRYNDGFTHWSTPDGYVYGVGAKMLVLGDTVLRAWYSAAGAPAYLDLMPNDPYLDAGTGVWLLPGERPFASPQDFFVTVKKEGGSPVSTAAGMLRAVWDRSDIIVAVTVSSALEYLVTVTETAPARVTPARPLRISLSTADGDAAMVITVPGLASGI
jgi:hypothetical protein